MPQKRFNFRLLFVSAISLIDDAIILTLLIIILAQFGIYTPVWLIILVAVLFIGWTSISYLAVKRNPQLGFENMMGATGITLDSLSPRGTIRIGREQWAAKARGGNIGIGVAVRVVDQNGLLLTVVRENPPDSIEQLH